MNRFLRAVGICAAVVVAAGCGTQKSETPLAPTVDDPIPGVNITPPNIVQPSGGARIPVGEQPIALTIENATSSGTRPLGYLFEIATDAEFTNKIFTREGIASGDDGHTTFRLSDALQTGQTYYWRVRAQDGVNNGPFTSSSFDIYTPPTVMPSPSADAPGTPADMMNLASAEVHGGPADVASWPVTTAITRITMSPAEGFAFEFSARSFWPDYTPPGWDGPIQYTVWPVVQVDGVWHIAACVRMWREKPSTGAFGLPTWHDHFPAHWSYNRGPEMAGYHPNPGDRMGFFVTAGNGRFEPGPTSVRERSNVVLITLPAGDVGTFTF